jgi:ribosomal-protein-alanine N-acetyltransferase
MNPPLTVARIRPMTPADLDRVMEIAGSLKEAPLWPRSGYLAALDPEAVPRRIALVAEQSAKTENRSSGVLPSGAKAPADFVGVMRGLKPPSPSNSSFSATCEAIETTCEAIESGEVVGFAVASLTPPQAELEIIGVAPAVQRRGRARQIFGELAAELGAAQVAEVYLEVRASNQPALELYRRLGFMVAGRRPRYYHDPIEDAVLMRLRLEGT